MNYIDCRGRSVVTIDQYVPDDIPDIDQINMLFKLPRYLVDRDTVIASTRTNGVHITSSVRTVLFKNMCSKILPYACGDTLSGFIFKNKVPAYIKLSHSNIHNYIVVKTYGKRIVMLPVPIFLFCLGPYPVATFISYDHNPTVVDFEVIYDDISDKYKNKIKQTPIRCFYDGYRIEYWSKYSVVMGRHNRMRSLKSIIQDAVEEANIENVNPMLMQRDLIGTIQALPVPDLQFDFDDPSMQPLFVVMPDPDANLHRIAEGFEGIQYSV